MGDEVSKLVVGCKQEVIGLSNLQPDGSVKVDNMEMVGTVTQCGKLTDDEFTIPKEFPSSVWVSEEYHLFCDLKGKKPVAVSADGLRGTQWA